VIDSPRLISLKVLRRVRFLKAKVKPQKSLKKLAVLSNHLRTLLTPSKERMDKSMMKL